MDSRLISSDKTLLWTPSPKTDLKQVWFAGINADIGGSYAQDKNTGAMSSNVSLDRMLNEANEAQLHLEAHIKNNLSTRPLAKIHNSRNHVYRLKKPLQRELIVADKPSIINPSVKERYLLYKRYRPQQLKTLLDEEGWGNIDTGL
jgi:ribosomal protein S15P/S13E